MSDIKTAPPSNPLTASTAAFASTAPADVEAAEDPNQLPVYTQADVDALFHPSTSQTPPTYTGLPQVVALPQLTTAFDSPFARAYSPALAAAGISQADWLDFQDGLNTAIIASPPLQIVDAVGMVIGFAPLLSTMIAGLATQVVAQTGQHVVSKTLTDKYLKSNNDKFFKQRGVVVRLVRGRALRQLVGKDPKTGEPTVLAKTGQTATSIGLHVPIVRKILSAALPAPEARGGAPRAPGSDQVDRRLAALSPEFIAPITRDVPPPKTPEGLLDRTSATAVKLRTRKTARRDARADRKQQIAAVRRGELSAADVKPADGLSEKKARKLERKAHKAERRAAKDERKGKGVRGKHVRRQTLRDRKAGIAEDKVLWLVVMTREQDEAVNGREGADGEGDVVVVQAEEWDEAVAAASEEGESGDESESDSSVEAEVKGR